MVKSDYCNDRLTVTEKTQISSMDFLEASRFIVMSGGFGGSCRCFLSNHSIDAIGRGELKVRIQKIGNKPVSQGVDISIASEAGNISLLIGDDSARAVFEKETSGLFDLRLWRSSSVRICSNTTSNGVRIVCDRSSVVVGRDCMISDGVLIQAADQHGIVDLCTGQIVNNRDRCVRVGDHVWLGRQSTLLPDVSIGPGSIVGAGAMVTKDVPGISIVAGIPAKVVRENATWSRDPVMLDSAARFYVDQYLHHMASDSLEFNGDLLPE